MPSYCSVPVSSVIFPRFFFLDGVSCMPKRISRVCYQSWLGAFEQGLVLVWSFGARICGAMADDSHATPEMETADVVDTTSGDTTSDGSTVTQDEEKTNGEAIVFGTVEPDALAKEEAAPPVQEETVPPAEEQSAPPSQEQSAPPSEEQSAPPAEEESAPPSQEQSAPPSNEQSAPPAEEEEAAPLVKEKLVRPSEEADPSAEEQSAPLEKEDSAPHVEEQSGPAEEERALAAEESGSDPTEAWTTTELARVATRIIPHLLNLYNSTPTADDYDAIYAPNATFEDPLMQAHGVAQIKSAFYAIPKVFLDSTVLKYAVWEEETSPASGEIHIENLQQYKLLQLGPFGYYVTMHALIKLTVERGKVVRHEDLWGGYRLWNRHTVWVPLVGRLAETMRRGNMLVTHILMGFGKDHKTLDKDSSSLHLKVS